MIIPQPLRKGDTIGVFSPSSPLSKDDLNKGKALLEVQGYKVFIHPQNFIDHGRLAGTDEEKIDAFHALIQNPDINCILCARGGTGALSLLPHIDYELIKKNPKAIVGFSDVTVLLNTITYKTGLVTFHGPMLKAITEDDTSLKAWQDCLEGTSIKETYNFFSLGQHLEILQSGKAHEPIYGGNLTVLLALLTAQPDMAQCFEGSILLIEDVGELDYRFDRSLTALFQNPSIQKISGLIVGVTRFETDNENTASYPRNLSKMIKKVISDRGLNIPAVMNAPFTHDYPHQTIPIGMVLAFNANKDTHLLTV